MAIELNLDYYNIIILEISEIRITYIFILFIIKLL